MKLLLTLLLSVMNCAEKCMWAMAKNRIGTTLVATDSSKRYGNMINEIMNYKIN